MSPEEIRLSLNAFAAAKRAEAEGLDALAWLTGRYAAIGVHSPKRYPRRPAGHERSRAMSDGEMKRALMELAERSERG